MADTTVGFCYVCHRRRANVVDVLESVRSHYPAAPVVLSCDGGDNFEDLCERYDCFWYSHPATIGMHFASIFKERKYLFAEDLRLHQLERHRRIQKAVDTLGVERIVFLEDDVRCIRRLEGFNDVAVAGPSGVRNWYRESTPYYAALVRKGVAKERRWFNCGGCKIWKRESWNDLSRYFRSNSQEVFREFGWKPTDRVQRDRRASWENFAIGDDRFDGLLALWLGHSTGDAYGVYDIDPAHCHPWQDQAAYPPNVSFVHQYKRMY